MVRFALLAGAVVAPLTALAVYVDAVRRSLPRQSRFVWACAVGLASFVGFLLPAVFSGSLHRLFFRLVHGRLVVVTPYELLLFDVGVGVGVTFFAVLAYVVVAYRVG